MNDGPRDTGGARRATGALTAAMYFFVGGAILALAFWDMYSDAILQDEALWTTIVENTVTLSVGSAVIGAGAWVASRSQPVELVALARWTGITVAFVLVVTLLIVGAQALQTQWKPWIMYANFLGALLLGGFAIAQFAARLREKERELEHRNRELRRYAQQIEELSLTDPLTGLPNRRRFDQFMAHHTDLAERHGNLLTVLMIDLDRFKVLNDAYGHQYGDEVLAKLAEVLMYPVRSTDVVARWGGEEFAVLAPETGMEGGFQLGKRLRQFVESTLSEEGYGHVTISVGVAERDRGESAEALIARADEALYHAKRGGRNRCFVADDAHPASARDA